MKQKRFWIVGLVVAFVFILGFAQLLPVSADVGNSFGGGGSSGGGGSYGGGSSFGGSWGGGSSFFLFTSPTAVLIFIVVIVIFAFINKGKMRNGVQGRNPYANPGVQPNIGFDETITIQEIQKDDPAFSADEFRSFSSEVWIALQEAWEAKEWQKVRPFESNALFNIHNRQLQEYIDRKKTNVMDMQNIRDVKIARYRKDQEHEIVQVKLDASLLDYVVDDTSGNVIDGSKTEYVHRSYNLEFIRSLGVKTQVKEGSSVTNCPNCGAPTLVTSSGQCEYCKSVITTGEYGWVLNKYAPWQN